jgi:quinol monooxygenase YgiN
MRQPVHRHNGEALNPIYVQMSINESNVFDFANVFSGARPGSRTPMLWFNPPVSAKMKMCPPSRFGNLGGTAAGAGNPNQTIPSPGKRSCSAVDSLPLQKEKVMVSQALLIRFEAKPGMDTEVEELLRSLHPMVQLETDTTSWFAIRFGRSEYGIFDVFPDQTARDAHLEGGAASALRKAGLILVKPPQIQKISVLDDKLPGFDLRGTSPPLVTKGLLLTFKAKAGHEEEVEEFLISSAAVARDEPKTTAWFALRLDQGEYGIFDVFPDNGGRFAHMVGRIPRDLARHAFTLLGDMPDLDLVSVIAAKLHG